MSKVVLFATHALTGEIWEKFSEIRLPRGYEKFIWFDRQNATPPEDHGVRSFTLHEDVTAAGYKTIARTLIPGSNHFPVIEFLLRHDYEWAWSIEYDVAFKGNWQTFFEAHDSSKADFLTACVCRGSDDPDWYWWGSLRAPGRLDDSKKLRSFNPIYRLTKKAAAVLRDMYLGGWVGHHEATIATCLSFAGLTVEDFGGTGEFTREANRGRWYTDKSHTFDHQTFVAYKYSWANRQDVILHPVKLHGSASETANMTTNIVCTLNVGRDCIDQNARSSIREAARRWQANYLEILVATGDTKLHHYYQKLRLLDHLPSNCRVLYLDGDVVIRSDCPSPFAIVPRGQLGWIRSHHPSHAGASSHIFQPMADLAKRNGVVVDVKEDYLHSGLMLFELPQHKDLFIEVNRIVAEQGFNSHWPIADQGLFTVARKKLGLEVFWLPPMFQMAGEELWAGWTAEMRFPVQHYCGPINRRIAIPRTVWDDLGPDRKVSGTNVTRWVTGKPRSLSGGPELAFWIREVSKVRHGQIAEVGCYLGGTTWWGARIAKDNYCQYICVDHWRGARDLSADDKIFQGFQQNMRDARLDEFVQIVKKPSLEAANGMRDNEFDLVFIDADHTREACLADIEAWYPKLKAGGVMLGHDYTASRGFGVIEAVAEAFGKPDDVSDGTYAIWKITKVEGRRLRQVAAQPQLITEAAV
jgi:hypothetical protein